jgi:hypothetical protein
MEVVVFDLGVLLDGGLLLLLLAFCRTAGFEVLRFFLFLTGDETALWCDLLTVIGRFL